MNVLYLYYSRTGHSEAAILKLRDLVNGEISVRSAKQHPDNSGRLLRITPKHGFGGPIGFIRGIITVIGKKPVTLIPPSEPVSLADYDLIVIAAPVWAGLVASPVRTFLEEHKGVKRTAYIICKASDSDCVSVFDQLDMLTGTKRDAAITIDGMKDNLEEKITGLFKVLRGQKTE